MTGVNYLLETKQTKILIDCGLFQGGGAARKMNRKKFAYQPKEIEAVLITHSHIDHIGRLPILFKQGFRGKIFATRPTKDFVRIMLFDAEKINRRTARTADKEFTYNQADVEKTLELFQPIDYQKKIELNKDVSFCLGSILWAS